MQRLFNRGQRFYHDDVVWLMMGFFVIGIIVALMLSPTTMWALMAALVVLSWIAFKKSDWPVFEVFLALFIPMVPGIISALIVLCLKSVNISVF